MKPKNQDPKKQPPAELATRQQTPTELTKGMPGYLQRPGAAAAAGTENMERQDWTLPRLGLCQAMTPQRKKSDQKFIQGLEEGQYFNTITRENYGERVKIVPLLFYKSRILWYPMEKGGGIRCQALDNCVGRGDPGGDCLRCPLALFGPKGERPECSQFYNYAALVIGQDGRVSTEGIVVTTFKSTSLKVSRDWNALIRLRGTDIFAGVYELTSIEVKDGEYSWWTPIINPAGWVSEETLANARLAYQAVREVNLRGAGPAFDASDLAPGREPRDERSTGGM